MYEAVVKEEALLGQRQGIGSVSLIRKLCQEFIIQVPLDADVLFCVATSLLVGDKEDILFLEEV
jgi:hypothetical protein